MSFLLAWFPSAWHLSPCTPAGPWQSRASPSPCLPEWQLLSDRARGADAAPSALLQPGQSTDATHLFHPWLLGAMAFLLFSLQVSLAWFFFHDELPFIGGVFAVQGPSGFSGFLVFQSCSGSVLGCISCLPAFLQGSAYDLPSYVLTAFTLLFSSIHF